VAFGAIAWFPGTVAETIVNGLQAGQIVNE
jgi:hypothetical protein